MVGSIFPYGGGYSPFGGAPPPSTSEEVEAIKFLLTLIPGWALNPDSGLVQPGHTLEYELEMARKVKEIKDKYDPPPPPPPPEEIEEDIFG